MGTQATTRTDKTTTNESGESAAGAHATHGSRELTPERLRELLPASSISLDAVAATREDAIRAAGAVLVRAGVVDDEYVSAMFDRERAVSTYMGDGIAMPHGTLSAKQAVSSDALVLLRFAAPVDWEGDQVTIVIGIAAGGRRYIALLSQLAAALLDSGAAAALRAATTADEVYAVFDGAIASA